MYPVVLLSFSQIPRWYLKLGCYYFCLPPCSYLLNPVTTDPIQSVLKTKLRGLSPRANYTDRATAAVGEVSANFCG
jgi:hypothetical protein